MIVVPRVDMHAFVAASVSPPAWPVLVTDSPCVSSAEGSRTGYLEDKSQWRKLLFSVSASVCVGLACRRRFARSSMLLAFDTRELRQGHVWRRCKVATEAPSTIQDAEWHLELTAERGTIVVAGDRGFREGDYIIDEPPLIVFPGGPSRLQALLNDAYALPREHLERVLKLHSPVEAAHDGWLRRTLGAKGDQLMNPTCPLTIPSTCHDVAEAFRLFKIAEANAYLVEVGDSSVDHMGLYEGLCRINHSCAPNAAQRVGEEKGHIEVVAARDIAPGEEVTVSYLSEEDLAQPTSRRRELLRKQWQFHCQCSRCRASDIDGDPCRAFICPGCGSPVYARDSRELNAVWLGPCGKCGHAWSELEVDEATLEERECAMNLQSASCRSQSAEKALEAFAKSRRRDAGQTGTQAVDDAWVVLRDLEQRLSALKHLHALHWVIGRLSLWAGRLACALSVVVESFDEHEMAQVLRRRGARALRSGLDATKQLGVPHGFRGQSYVQDLFLLGDLEKLYQQYDRAKDCYQEAAAELRVSSLRRGAAYRQHLRAELAGVEDAIQRLQNKV